MRYLYCVSKSGDIPVQKQRIRAERPDSYLLDTSICRVVRKSTMENAHCAYFTNEAEAYAYHDNLCEWYAKLRTVFNVTQTNCDRVHKMAPRELAAELTKLFYEISDKTNASHYIENWLRTEV